MKHTLNLVKIACLAMLSFATFACVPEIAYEGDETILDKAIIASIDGMVETRVSIDSETSETGGTIYYYWAPGDEIGVYTDANETNIQYFNTEREREAESVTFIPATDVKGTPLYVYYPYSSNAGNDYTAVKGNVPCEQDINESLNNIPGMYRYGYFKSEDNGEYTFGFKHTLSTIRWHLDVSGTELEGRKLHSVEIKIMRGTKEIPVCGDFTFNAETGDYRAGENTSNLVTLNFDGQPYVDNAITFYSTMFPSVKKGDYMYFTVNTVGRTARYYVKSSVTFKKDCSYTYSMPINGYYTLNVFTNDILDKDEVVPEPEQPSEPESNVGTFTCATYNIDGLPSIAANTDGPGSSGTKTISQKIAVTNWDFIGFSEDFDNHDELTSALSGTYNFGTYRGSVGLSQLFGSVADTDGLGFAWKKNISANNEKYIQFTSSYGGLTSGANDCIKKGIRHYELTIAPGVVIDVLMTHMNTYSDKSDSFINAQHAQLKQVAEYINTVTAQNHRPVIFMGDTNCRYTRHDFQTYFWGILNNNLIVKDPWVDTHYNGKYPAYPSNSLVTEDAPDPSSSDIICSNQAGEVVDKIIYINDLEGDTFIVANSYLRDMNFSGLADHCPIVVEFLYEKL